MINAAKNYRGEDLQKRGAPFPVLPRAEIMAYAYDLARNVAEKPRVSLVTSKEHLVADLCQGLYPVIKQELEMHKKTIHQPEVRQRIDALFGS